MEYADWRAKTFSRIRALIKEADPDSDVVEEWKWVRPSKPRHPGWSHDSSSALATRAGRLRQWQKIRDGLDVLVGKRDQLVRG